MTLKKNVVIFGAGKIGSLVAVFLAKTQDYAVTLVDGDNKLLETVRAAHPQLPLQTKVGLFATTPEAAVFLKGAHYALSCAPFFCNTHIATAARQHKVHYLDLTEDVATTQTIRTLAQNAPCAFIPQCGLAPGFITIVTHDLMRDFDSLDTVHMRVGALPQYPNNRLKYNLTWSTDGLINEYCHPCQVIKDGILQTVEPLEGEERLIIAGEEFEAFNTSGGLGTLAQTYAGRVQHMNYKSIRYPGHRFLLLTLLHDLKFIDDRDGLKAVFERSLPHTLQDMIVIFVTVQGYKQGLYTQKSYVQKIPHSTIDGTPWGAIQVTTAAGLCAALDLHAHGRLPQTGFVRQEEISLDEFIKNRFGSYYQS